MSAMKAWSEDHGTPPAPTGDLMAALLAAAARRQAKGDA